MTLKKKIKADISGERLDVYLARVFNDFTRSKCKKLIECEAVLVNGNVSNSSYKVKEGDKIEVKIEDAVVAENVEPWDFDLEVLKENKNFVLINKPPFVSVHPALGQKENTIVNALVHKYQDSLSGVKNLKPGIVHRLDKDTSGCLLVAKNDKAHVFYADQFKDRKVKKTYLALVNGVVDPAEGTIDSPVGRSYKDRKKMSVHTFTGRNAVTHYKVVKSYKDCSLVEVDIETGRTHQIRVHLAAIGYPVIGDTTYGSKKTNNFFRDEYGLERQFLHAQKLSFKDLDGKTYKCEAPLLDDLDRVLMKLL
jgi:23S rRNA pseudouridine1911/1915/1917 synthase